MELYESMNEKIADIIAIDGTPSSLYASAYIKDLRAENAKLKAETKQAEEKAVKEFAEKLLKDFGEQRHFYEVASIGHKDVSLASIDYCIRQIKRQLKELYTNES